MKRTQVRSVVAFGIAALALGAGCAGVQVKVESLEKVKTVAVVNLTTSNQMNQGGTGGNSGIGGLVSGIHDIKAMANGSAQAQYRARMEAIYDLVDDKVAGAGFTTVKRGEVAANPQFPAVYSKLTRVQLGDDPGGFVASGGQVNLRRLSDRVQILDALGVDAVAAVDVVFQTGKTGGASIGGFGALKRYPQAVVNFFVYDRVSADPIWADYRVVGATASDGFQETMGVKDTKDPGPIFVEATSSALDLLIERFQKARLAPPAKK